MGQPGDAAVQKYNFRTPGQSQNCIRGKLFDLLKVYRFPEEIFFLCFHDAGFP
jgi:hypothetical protein